MVVHTYGCTGKCLFLALWAPTQGVPPGSVAEEGRGQGFGRGQWRWAWSGVQACPVILVSLCPGLSHVPRDCRRPHGLLDTSHASRRRRFQPQDLRTRRVLSLDTLRAPSRTRAVHALGPHAASRRTGATFSSVPRSFRVTPVTPPKCVRPCAVGGSSLPALPDGASHEHAARPFPRHCRPYLAPALLWYEGTDGHPHRLLEQASRGNHSA